MHEVETMMYNQVNGLPWHKLGTSVNGLATSADAIKRAGLNWTVETQPLFTKNGTSLDEVEMGKVVVRQSDDKPLGIVGNRYTPLQNVEAFEFFDNIVGEEQAIYETAGSLKGGKHIWLLAKMPDFIRIEGTDDLIEKYVLLSNTHDGSGSIKVKITPIRVVCANTLSFALRSHKKNEVSIRHTKNVNANLMEAQKTLGLVNTIYTDLNQIFNEMARKQINMDSMDEYYNMVFNDGEEEVSTRTQNQILDVKRLIEEGAGVNDPMMRKTKYSVWGMYNTVTEYVDHFKTYQERTDKLHSIGFGGGAKIKEKAFAEAMKMIN